MELKYIILIGTMLMCSIGIASAANETEVDASKIVNMADVKTQAVHFYDANSDPINTILGIALAAAIITIAAVVLFGGAVSSIGSNAAKDANTTNKGRKMTSDAVYAAGMMVLALVLVSVALAMI